MSTQKKAVIILGAGLTGLSLAYLFQQNGIKATVLEARDRVGGRIYTQQTPNGGKIEMGATWLGKKHQALLGLLSDLNIDITEQLLGKHAIYEPISTSPPQLVSLPHNDEPTYRIKGGSTVLIDTLVSKLDTDKIFLSEVVKAIRKEGDVFTIETQNNNFSADWVVSTLPPYLLSKTITISPELPAEVVALASQTHTWMGESIKIGFSYERPFWRDVNKSGTIFRSVGPVSEMYDHSDDETQHFALKGFMSGAYSSTTKAHRLAVALAQLEKYYGSVAADYLSYEEAVWSTALFTYLPYASQVLPHQNNGHQLFRQAYLGGQFFIAGSETAAQHPGYMDGAVASAFQVYQAIKGTAS